MSKSNSWDNVATQLEKGPGSTLKVVIIWVLIIGFVGMAVNVIFKPFNLIGTVMDNDKIIYNYEWFHQQHQDLKAIQRKVQIADNSKIQFIELAGDRTNWDFEDKTEYSRLASIADGLRYQYNDMAATYNARSSMTTREIFKSDILPYKVQIK